LLEKVLTLLRPSCRVAALVGELATENDAQRLARSGAPVKLITTGTVCHLEAAMVRSALQTVVYARDAADRYLKANLQSAEQVGIFTTSGESQSDFTDNMKQLHDALLSLRSSPAEITSKAAQN
jgi:Ni2+-binding GTPase involved in maturation of urease and hydrogenase